MRSKLHTLARWLVAISLVLSTILLFANDQIFSEDEFARLISSSVEEPAVRELLATAAIDVALDASNADAELAARLPDDLSLVATPAIELAKPTVAEAGAALLGIDQVGSSLEQAARSVHRQAMSSLLADDEQDVVLSTLPVLVVVADEIAGDAGARAVVGLDIPEGATSINMGSNQQGIWTVLLGLTGSALLFLALFLLAILAFFLTSPAGTRVIAFRRLGRTFLHTGFVVLGLAWVTQFVAGTVVAALLVPNEPLTFSSISIGGTSDLTGAYELARVILSPLISAATQIVTIGLIMIVGGYALDAGPVAVGLRDAISSKSFTPLLESLRETLPSRLRATHMGIWASLILGLLAWPEITTRVAVTLVVATLLGVGALHSLSATGSRWSRFRQQFDIPTITETNLSSRSVRSGKLRRAILPAAVLIAVIWPSYSSSGLTQLALLVAIPMALTYRYEGTHPAEEPALELTTEQSRWSTKKRLIAAAMAIAAAVVVVAPGGSVQAVSIEGAVGAIPTVCNGFADLCVRPLDEVAFAGTHNSMSSSELGWELANHGGAIPAQLDGGIRALLIDVQKWEAVDNLDGLAIDPAAQEIARDALAVAEAPEDGLWMCHKLCQLGGTPFGEFLATLMAFTVANPNEVIIIVIQDEAEADDIKAAIVRAGLDEFAFAHEPGSAWPTLGELISDNTRLVFMAENNADNSGWYQLAFGGNVSETDYSYAVVEDFECAANRGGNDGELFMINHWVETGLPVPSEADAVNSSDVLHARVDECRSVRGRDPGIIAVNFWERGDLLTVVNELNGVAG